jgi:nicotinate-nucleotide pyrophosphorylase (carboxylating)
MPSTKSSPDERIIEQALAEDHVRQDITTQALVTEAQRGKASMIAKAKGIVSGVKVAEQVFLKVDHRLKLHIFIPDGAPVEPGDVIAQIEGRVASILKAERVALNFLQHLSGIATETNLYVQAVKGLPVRVTDTRKTTPGLRMFEKRAVRDGGGQNHRMHLADGILIKDNHLAALRRQGLSIKEIIDKARQKAPPRLKIEIEAKTPGEAEEDAEAGADIIMLDNMGLHDIRRSVQLIKSRATIEASGGITLDRIRAIAEAGVDIISVGAITHSARNLDISLELS